MLDQTSKHLLRVAFPKQVNPLRGLKLLKLRHELFLIEGSDVRHLLLPQADTLAPVGQGEAQVQLPLVTCVHDVLIDIVASGFKPLDYAVDT